MISSNVNIEIVMSTIVNTNVNSISNQGIPVVWKDFSYDLPYRIVTIPEIRKSLNSLWSEIYSDPQSHQDMIFIQFKVRTGRHLTRSISYVQRVGYSDLNQLLSYFLGFWSVRSDLYKVEQFYQIVYTYKMIPKINTE